MVGNSGQLESFLHQAISKTLEEMSFSEVFKPEDESLVELSGKQIVAQLKVVEPKAGELTLILSEGLACDLTKATFGFLEGPPTEDMVKDAMGEFVNTIFGCALNDVLEGGQAFMLDLPETKVLDAKDLDKGNGRRLFSVNNAYIALDVTGPIFQ